MVLLLWVSMLSLGAGKAGPADALAELQAYGEVPECRVVSEDPVTGRPQPLERLQGATPKLKKYLASPYEPVVRRAAELLCWVHDAPAQSALRELQRRYPCLSWIDRLMAGAGVEIVSTCQVRDDAPGSELMAPLDVLAKWKSPASAKLAARLAAADAAAFDEATDALLRIDVKRRRTAAAALAAVDTVEGWRALRHWLAARTPLASIDAYAMGVSLASLTAVVGKGGPLAANAVFAVAAQLEAGEVRSLASVAMSAGVWPQVQQHVRDMSWPPKGAVGARRLASHVRLLTMSASADVYPAEVRLLDAMKKAGDREGLLKEARSPARFELQRLYAAQLLAELGDGSALDLFEQEDLTWVDPASARAALESLRRSTSGALRERVEKALAAPSLAR